MSPARSEIQQWLSDEFISSFSTALETMAGDRPAMSCEPGPPTAIEKATLWRQPVTSIPGAVWVSVLEVDWKAVGEHVLRAAGIEDSDRSSLKSTYLEMLTQALAGISQAITARIHREVTLGSIEESSSVPPTVLWERIRISVSQSGSFLLGFDSALLDALTVAAEPPSLPSPTDSRSEMALEASGSRTFDLLLDVELPVSVSFGRAQVQLKDVLKLTTGSIVELNRSIGEPVEVIVNNCVIARGEVVVVEGNFGVRIQNVISRQERLRTLS